MSEVERGPDLEFGAGSLSGSTVELTAPIGQLHSPRGISSYNAKATGTPETLSRQVPSKPKTGSNASPRNLGWEGGKGLDAYSLPINPSLLVCLESQG